MTFKDIIDTLVRDSGDEGSNYRSNALRWLNFVRQEAAVLAEWKSGKDSEGTLITDAGNTTGVYALPGYKSLCNDEIYDATNDAVIRRDTEMMLKAFDANQDEFGFPTLWADSGMNSDGELQVRFWPIPNDAFTLLFLGNKLLTDITRNHEMLTVDPYYGPLSTVGGMLLSGLRFYHDQNDNQDTVQVARSRAEFKAAIKLYSSSTGADSVRSSRLEPVGRRPNARPFGRLDPSHFNNRG